MKYEIPTPCINILDRTEPSVPADQLRSARSSRSLAFWHHYRPMNAVLAQRAARECWQVSTKRRHVAPEMEVAGRDGRARASEFDVWGLEEHARSLYKSLGRRKRRGAVVEKFACYSSVPLPLLWR